MIRWSEDTEVGMGKRVAEGDPGATQMQHASHPLSVRHGRWVGDSVLPEASLLHKQRGDCLHFVPFDVRLQPYVRSDKPILSASGVCTLRVAHLHALERVVTKGMTGEAEGGRTGRAERAIQEGSSIADEVWLMVGCGAQGLEREAEARRGRRRALSKDRVEAGAYRVDRRARRPRVFLCSDYTGDRPLLNRRLGLNGVLEARTVPKRREPDKKGLSSAPEQPERVDAEQGKRREPQKNGNNPDRRRRITDGDGSGVCFDSATPGPPSRPLSLTPPVFCIIAPLANSPHSTIGLRTMLSPTAAYAKRRWTLSSTAWQPSSKQRPRHPEGSITRGVLQLRR
ncbi:hypothetical protein NMY22_g14403 [Coprinellus aureogranulatus]|nr:hypothetical protein NMY22_g14403 [Coprinellus aureogranulatus]